MMPQAILAIVALTFPLLPTKLSGQEHEHATERLGRVELANSCSAPVQVEFQQAVAMLHSFRYIEAEKAFNGILRRDSTCAMAAWGLASILMTNPLTGMGPPSDKAARGEAAAALARRIGGPTQREQDWIEAMAAYWDDWDARPERDRQASRARAYEALATRYPDDDEAQIFAALYIAGTQSLSDTTFAAYRRAAAMLNAQLLKHPDHPGIAHYLIHTSDAPALAQGGIPAAESYAAIAPDAPHALHMPSHIYTRVGWWKESAETNERSAAAAAREGEGDEELHAMDYLVYAWLQLGRDADARRVAALAPGIIGLASQRFVAPYAAAAMPARIALERNAWGEAASLAPRPDAFGFTTALTVYARALGGVHTGDLTGAQREILILARIRDSLRAAKADYWAGEVEVSRRSASAWLQLAQGDTASAIAAMEAAAAQEDRSEKHIVTPGRLLPARELLGDMLLACGQPSNALREYERSQVREPNRLRGYAGAAEAARLGGDTAKADFYYGKVIELAGATDRPEVVAARRWASNR